MTAPGDDFTTRLKQAAVATGGNKPAAAYTLASSDLTDGDIDMAGGFIQALETSQLVKLARYSGAKTDLTPTQRAQMDALGEPYEDVNTEDPNADSRNWFERQFENVAVAASNTGEFLTSNPVTGALLSTFNKMLDVVKLPARILGSAIDSENDDEIDAAMTAKGYDPGNAWDYIQFMTNQGESLYHDLDPIRQEHSDEIVDLALEQASDPEGFAERLLKRDEATQKLAQSEEFAQVADLVNRAHISPGRDIARIILPKDMEDGAAFTAISGTLDAAYTLLLDPTLFVGKVARGVRALDAAGNVVQPMSRTSRWTGVALATKAADRMTGGKYRTALRDVALDTDGVLKLFAVKDGRPVTKAGERVDDFLKKVKAWDDEADAGQKSVLFAELQARHQALMPFLDEVTGKSRVTKMIDNKETFEGVSKDINGFTWETTKGERIETLDQWAKYFADTTAFLRLSGGAVAKREHLLPGRIAVRQRVAGELAKRRQKAHIVDHSRPGSVLPDDSEEAIQAALDAARTNGETYHNILKRGTPDGEGWAPIRRARAHMEQRIRRFTTLAPTTSSLDLTDTSSIKTVRDFARMYMSKAEADRLAALYAAGDLGQRRQVMHGIIEQTFHAAGLSKSEAGLKEIERFRADQLDMERRAYGFDGVDVIKTPDGLNRHVAMVPSQLSTTVLMPDFKSLHYLASKYAYTGYLSKLGILRAGFEGDALDAVSRAVKQGWITSSAGGFRNALDEIAGAVSQGDLSIIRGRQMFSAVTKAGRDASKVNRQAKRAAARAEHRFLGRIPISLRGAADTVNDVFVANALGKVLSFKKDIDEKDVQYAERFVKALGEGEVRESITGTWFFDDAARLQGNDEALAIAGNGMMATSVQHNGEKVAREFHGWKQLPLDGGAGLDRWVDNLGQYFADTSSPAHVVLRGIVDGDDQYAQQMAVIGYMNEPVMRHFRENAEIFKVIPSTGKRVASEADQQRAIQEYAQRLVVQVHKLVTGKGRPVYRDDLVTQAREWKSTGMRARAGARAGDLEARQPELAEAADASAGYASAAARARDDLLATERTHKANDAVQVEIGRLDEKIAKVEQRLEAAQGRDAYRTGDGDFDALWKSALHRKWDKAGNQTQEVQVINRDGVLTASIHRFGKNYGSKEVPVEYIYRVVSRSDLERMRREGKINTNGQYSHGRYDDPEGLDRPQMFGGIVPTQLAKTYGAVTDAATGRAIDAEDTVLLKIKYEPGDGWYKDMSDGNSSYVATRQELPIERLVDAAPFRAVYDEATEKTTVRGVKRRAPIDEAAVKGAQQQVSSATKEVERLKARLAERREARENAKANRSTQPATLARLRERVAAAEKDLAKAKRAEFRAKEKLARAEGQVTDAERAQAPRIEANLQRLQARRAELEARIVAAGDRPSDVELQAARLEAKASTKEARLARTKRDSTQHQATNARLNESYAFADNGAVDDDDLRRFADDQGVNLEDYVSGRSQGTVDGSLAEMLLNGEIPDRAWLKTNVADHNRPEHVIGKVWMPVNPKHAVGQIAQGYQSMLTKVYDQVVTKQVNALSRHPMMVSAYGQARRNLEKWEQSLKDAGFSEENADAIAHRMAMGHAEQLVIKSIDNPQVATQYSILARNFHAFARAQEDWLRRWGRIIRDNPDVIRKGQLAIHGAESAGLVERNDEGDLVFTYPGSGMMIDAFNRLFTGLGMSERVKAPMMPDLQSQLMFLNPSLDNPLGFSGMPVVSIGFDAMAATLGADYPLIMSSMDKVVNGELGAGREWYEKLLPGFANRIIDGVWKDEDPASQLASAYTQALANLEAAGRLDDITGLDPTAKARLLNDLKSQVSNQMVARALFGFFAPASPSTPTNDVIDADTGEWVLDPDFVFHEAGLGSLKDEARYVFAKLPYEKALEWWAANHPGELIYQQGAAARTEVEGSEASAPATLAAAKWMQDNKGFLDKYGGKGGAGAYFLPQGEAGTPGGTYSNIAYRAQLENGIREYKTLDEYFDDIIVMRGEKVYYDTKDDYDDAIAAANAAGRKYEAERLTDEWIQKRDLIKQANPLMAAKFDAFATSGGARDRTIAQLNDMLSDPEAVSTIGADQAGAVAQLLLAKREFDAAFAVIKGERGYSATSKREEARMRYQQMIDDVGARYPGLGDLIRGAFRVDR